MSTDSAMRQEEPTEPPVAPAFSVKPPWGPLATIGWSLLLLLVMLVVQLVVFFGFVIARGATTPKAMEQLAGESLLLSISTLVSTPVSIGLIVLLIWLRGCSIRDYLAWRVPGPKAAILAVVGLALLLVATDVITYLLGRPIVPPVMVDVYRSGYFLPLIITLVVAAPLGEEILFRGFFYQGVRSKWGPLAAIVLSSLAWSAIHLQYDLYMISTIFFMGLYLGEVRRRTDSLLLTIFLHAIANSFATLEMMILTG